jgi:hypothetical protein
MWNMKRFITPVMTGATGIVTKALKTFRKETRKAFNRFCAKDGYMRNVAYSKVSDTV